VAREPRKRGAAPGRGPRAAWLLLDTTTLEAVHKRVEYDVRGAAAAIRAARLPESLAERLIHGQ
jgi:diadenosine tetraphosphatase ApaH/serine/threonine PP2A family protein phosphatase